MGKRCDARCRTVEATCEVASACEHEDSALIDEWVDRPTDWLVREFECNDCLHRYLVRSKRAA